MHFGTVDASLRAATSLNGRQFAGDDEMMMMMMMMMMIMMMIMIVVVIIRIICW